MNYTLLQHADVSLKGWPDGMLYAAGRAPTRVLALHPDLDLSRVRNWTVGCS